MPVYTVINSNTNIVVNSIIAANSSYDPGPGFYLGPEGGSHGDTYSAQANTFTPPAVIYEALEALQTKAKDRAWNYMETVLNDATVNVTINAVSYPFTADAEARENIMGINTAIAVGVPVPDPRPWFPKGYTVPIQVTHADLASIGAAILAEKDAVMQVYFTHKAVIGALTDPQAVLDYDVTTGYTG